MVEFGNVVVDLVDVLVKDKVALPSMLILEPLEQVDWTCQKELLMFLLLPSVVSLAHRIDVVADQGLPIRFWFCEVSGAGHRRCLHPS